MSQASAKGSEGKWHCAEVRLTESLGYGRYAVTLTSGLNALDPQVVVGLFTYDLNDPSHHHREIDIGFSRWGGPTSHTGRTVCRAAG